MEAASFSGFAEIRHRRANKTAQRVWIISTTITTVCILDAFTVEIFLSVREQRHCIRVCIYSSCNPFRLDANIFCRPYSIALVATVHYCDPHNCTSSSLITSLQSLPGIHPSRSYWSGPPSGSSPSHPISIHVAPSRLSDLKPHLV